MSKRQKKKKPSFSVLRFIGISLGIVLILTVTLGAIGTAVLVSRLSKDLPDDAEILAYQANEASIIYDRNGKIITKLYLENRRPVALKDISRWMIMSTLAAEDSSFYSHHGVRPTAIIRSLVTGEGGHGASTITQQLARNLFLSTDQTLIRKGKEAILSLRLEKLYSKDKILETYLNAIYFGHGAWGIGAASQAYFGKSAKDLNLSEASVLAGLIAAPEKYSPIRSKEKAKKRQNYVLQRLVTLGWINQEKADKAKKSDLNLNTKTIKNVLNVNRAPYFVSHLLFKKLLPKYGRDRVYTSGLKIYTTLDIDLQEVAEQTVSKMKSEGALVALDPETGEILSLVGGKNFEDSKFNRATQAYRQPGSAFKPILYTVATEQGYLPTDHIMDSPISFEMKESVNPVWSPGNYSGKYNGEETLFMALTHSHNTPAVRLTELVGVDAVLSMSRRLGVTSPYLPPALSIGLGTASVTPLEMGAVYCVYANNGKKVTPYSIREIKNSNGKILESHRPHLSEAIDPSTAIIMRSMLIDVVQAGTGYRGRMKGYEVFGKTGTTNEFRDAWFVGGLPGLVTCVYAGNDDHKPLGRKATGSQIALPVWSNFMKQAVAMRTYPSRFNVPEDLEIKKVAVCRKTGYLAGKGCKVANLYMPVDRAPESTCPFHGGSPLMAMEDPNAPRLLLLPQDENLPIGQMDQIPAVVEKPVTPSTPPANIVPLSDPYANEVDTPRTIEDKYQKLLKSYGLSD